MVKPSSFTQLINFSDSAINDYLDALETNGKNTQRTAKGRLVFLPDYAKEKMDTTVTELIKDIKAGKKDVYEVLSKYATYIKKLGKSEDRISKAVKQARLLFEFKGIETSDRAFRQRVKLARPIKRKKQAVDKAFVTEIIMTCPDPILRLVLLFHAATGRRPEEIFSLRHTDIDTKKRVFRIRGEFTKMRVEQERPMAQELADALEKFIVWKHRPRRIRPVTPNGRQGESIHIEPKVRPYDLLFSEYRRDETFQDVSPRSLYNWYTSKLNDHLDRIGKGERISNAPKSPRKFTLYRLRDFVKTTISNLGYGDYSEWYIGHDTSTYYNPTDEEIKRVFRIIEPYLTYLDVQALEARGAAMEVKVEQSNEQLNVMHKQMRILAEMAMTNDPKVKQQKMKELAALGGLETIKMD